MPCPANGRAAGARDQDFQATLLRRRRVFEEQIGRAMRRDNARLEGDGQRLQRLRAVEKRFPIGSRAHDHAYERLGIHCVLVVEA